MATTAANTSLPRGRDLLRDPRYNRGTAFTWEERSALGLEGLLPAAVLSLADQALRSYDQYRAQPTELAKNDFLAALHDRNEVLYYKLLEEHLEEMLPVVYDPVVAQAIERYSYEFQRPNGVYLSVDDVDGVEAAFRDYGLDAGDVDLVVATDGEEILRNRGLGRNGIAISIGKLAVYTAAAGVHPDRVIPVMLDVGTDRESLLNDPVYVGNRHSRVRGERYDRLIAAYVETATRLFPNALLHFEDFGPSNARRILNEHRGEARIFNDDMQGTGAITLAAVLAGMRVAGSRAREQRVVVFGAGLRQLRHGAREPGLRSRRAGARHARPARRTSRRPRGRTAICARARRAGTRRGDGGPPGAVDAPDDHLRADQGLHALRHANDPVRSRGRARRPRQHQHPPASVRLGSRRPATGIRRPAQRAACEALPTPAVSAGG
jgi:Malic enzyme, N-terminal domain/Malic enzyme, NAD binding domain